MTASTPAPSAPTQPTVVPSEVGWQFVPQYYTFVNKQPNRLHCFYTKSSTFIHGTEGEDGKPCFGQQVSFSCQLLCLRCIGIFSLHLRLRWTALDHLEAACASATSCAHDSCDIALNDLVTAPLLSSTTFQPYYLASLDGFRSMPRCSESLTETRRKFTTG
jgi:hypothetical protein